VHQKDTVRLAAEARGVCQAIVKRRKGTAEQVTRAPRLRQAAADGPAWSEGKRAEASECRVPTVATVRTRGVTAGVAVARARHKRSTAPTPHTLEGVAAAPLSARRCGTPPAGDGRWSWHRRADAWVAVAVGASLGPETGRQTRKKTACPHVSSRTG
jgi:hypothetical protein